MITKLLMTWVLMIHVNIKDSRRAMTEAPGSSY